MIKIHGINPGKMILWARTGYSWSVFRRKPAPDLIRGGNRSASGKRVKNLERFRAKWTPVRVKKTRQNKNLELRSDSIGTE
jgi:hypothetical protein